MSTKGFSLLIIILFIALIAGAGAGFYAIQKSEVVPPDDQEKAGEDQNYRKKIEDLEKCGPQPGAPVPEGCLGWICENGGWNMQCPEKPEPPLPAPSPQLPQPPPTQTPDKPKCVIGGCSGELCVSANEEPIVSICIFKPEFACYQKARCETQSNGKCGWTQTQELTACIANAKAAVEDVIPSPTATEIKLEANDNGFYPSATLSLAKGEKVKLTFVVRTTGVYYAGLDFRSSKFVTGTLNPGESKTVEFTANESFTITSYWPASGVKKADLKIAVE